MWRNCGAQSDPEDRPEIPDGFPETVFERDFGFSAEGVAGEGDVGSAFFVGTLPSSTGRSADGWGYALVGLVDVSGPLTSDGALRWKVPTDVDLSGIELDARANGGPASEFSELQPVESIAAELDCHFADSWSAKLGIRHWSDLWTSSAWSGRSDTLTETRPTPHRRDRPPAARAIRSGAGVATQSPRLRK